MKPVPVSSVERVVSTRAMGTGRRVGSAAVSRGQPGSGDEKKTLKPKNVKPKTAISPRHRRRSIFPAFALLRNLREKDRRGRKIPFLAIFPISSGAFPPRTRSLAFHETPESTWKRVRMSETAERLFCAQTLVFRERMMGMCGARDPSVRGACGAGSRGSSARGARPEPPRTFGVDRRERVAQLLRRRERTPRLRGFRSERQTRPRGVLQSRVGHFLRVEVR